MKTILIFLQVLLVGLWAGAPDGQPSTSVRPNLEGQPAAREITGCLGQPLGKMLRLKGTAEHWSKPDPKDRFPKGGTEVNLRVTHVDGVKLAKAVEVELDRGRLQEVQARFPHGKPFDGLFVERIMTYGHIAKYVTEMPQG